MVIPVHAPPPLFFFGDQICFDQWFYFQILKKKNWCNYWDMENILLRSCEIARNSKFKFLGRTPKPPFVASCLCCLLVVSSRRTVCTPFLRIPDPWPSFSLGMETDFICFVNVMKGLWHLCIHLYFHKHFRKYHIPSFMNVNALQSDVDVYILSGHTLTVWQMRKAYHIKFKCYSMYIQWIWPIKITIFLVFFFYLQIDYFLHR